MRDWYDTNVSWRVVFRQHHKKPVKALIVKLNFMIHCFHQEVSIARLETKHNCK